MIFLVDEVIAPRIDRAHVPFHKHCSRISSKWFHILYMYCKSSTYFFSNQPVDHEIKFMKIFEIVYTFGLYYPSVKTKTKSWYIPLDSTDSNLI